MGIPHVMKKPLIPMPWRLALYTWLAATCIYVPTGSMAATSATSVYTTYWCLSMVHHVRSGPPPTHDHARLTHWSLVLSVPGLALALMAAVAVSLWALSWATGMAYPTETMKTTLAGIPLATAATMLYLGDFLQTVSVSET